MVTFETQWTKKLEDYGDDDEENKPFRFSITPKNVPDNESRRYQKDEEDENQESMLDSMLKNGALKQNLMKKRN